MWPSYCRQFLGFSLVFLPRYLSFVKNIAAFVVKTTAYMLSENIVNNWQANKLKSKDAVTRI